MIPANVITAWAVDHPWPIRSHLRGVAPRALTAVSSGSAGNSGAGAFVSGTLPIAV